MRSPPCQEIDNQDPAFQSRGLGRIVLKPHHRPNMYFPISNSVVRVRMIDTTTEMTIRAESFVKPVQKGHEILNITDVAFLIEHEVSGKKVMYIPFTP